MPTEVCDDSGMQTESPCFKTSSPSPRITLLFTSPRRHNMDQKLKRTSCLPASLDHRNEQAAKGWVWSLCSALVGENPSSSSGTAPQFPVTLLCLCLQ